MSLSWPFGHMTVYERLLCSLLARKSGKPLVRVSTRGWRLGMPGKGNFTVSLSAADRQLLDTLAEHEERRPGDMLRVCLREAARRRGLLTSRLNIDANAKPRKGVIFRRST